ncbi:uncharacterized protein ISCGN_003729 [Ixodes scapularis]
MSFAGAVITAPAGRGDSAFSGDEEYRIALPQLPSGEAMKRAVVLHADMASRLYRLEDFRRPLGDAGVLGEVARIGAFEMSHVWLLDLRTDAAKQRLLGAGQLVVKGRKCLIVDPYRQELRVKLHWVSFGVTNDAIHRAFADYGEVKEVAHERWKMPGFDGVESTTRVVRLVLREGVSLDRLPHQLRLGGGMVLVVVPGRAPLCLRCRMTGHIRRDCRAHRCTECRAFGHERADCVRSYARAAGRRAYDDNTDDLMDEDEAEKAAAPAGTTTEQPKEVDDSTDIVPTVGNTLSPQQPSTTPPAPPQAVEPQPTAASSPPQAAGTQSAALPGRTQAGAAQAPEGDPPRRRWTPSLALLSARVRTSQRPPRTDGSDNKRRNGSNAR